MTARPIPTRRQTPGMVQQLMLFDATELPKTATPVPAQLLRLIEGAGLSSLARARASCARDDKKSGRVANARPCLAAISTAVSTSPVITRGRPVGTVEHEGRLATAHT